MPATITHRFPRYIALPAVSRPGSSAAPGAWAWPAWPTRSTYPSHDPTPRTGTDTRFFPGETGHPAKTVRFTHRKIRCFDFAVGGRNSCKLIQKPKDLRRGGLAAYRTVATRWCGWELASSNPCEPYAASRAARKCA